MTLRSALALPLDGPALLLALMLALRGGRLALDRDCTALLVRELQAPP